VADLTLRTVKGSELTFGEIDRNFTSLDSDIKAISGGHWDSADTMLVVDSDYVQSRQAFSAFDSDEVTSIIDSDYIEAHLDGIDASDGGNDF
jgi:hypothetical protein